MTDDPGPAADPALAVTPQRQKIAAIARWGVQHKGEIAYAEVRPIDGLKPLHRFKLPLTTDCSGFVTLCFAWTDPQSSDPTGRGFDGYGYTGSMVAHCTPIDESWLIPGDLVVFGPGSGTHVVVVVSGAGSACRVVGHGSSTTPSEYALSDAKRYFAKPARPLRVPGVRTKASDSDDGADDPPPPAPDTRTNAPAGDPAGA